MTVVKNKKMKKIFRIEGMHCKGCAKLIEAELEGKVKSIRVSYEDKKAEIDFDESRISEDEIKKIIKELGYKAK